MKSKQKALRFLAVLVVFSALLPPPLVAGDIDQPSWTETREKWGQVIFCQRIYTMPEVQTRLYDFDVEHCNAAGQLMSELVSRYSEHQQALLKQQAEQHAAALSHNTSEPYHSVAACREYCRELTELQETRNDQ